MQDEIAKDNETHGAMFVPIILGSDKTTVSGATGQTEYNPLYASIGTVHNNVRWAHHNAVSIIGFLAIPKSEFVSTIFQTCAHLYVIQRIGSTKMMPSSASSDGSSFIPQLRTSSNH